jgi:hypothetical protein
LAGVFETFGDGGRPGIEAEAEADGDALMDVRLGFGNSRGEFAEQTAAGKLGVDQVVALVVQNFEDALEGVGDFLHSGSAYAGHKTTGVLAENIEQHVFLGAEKTIETAGVGFGSGEDFVDGGHSLSE